MVEPFPGAAVAPSQPPWEGSHLLHVTPKVQHVGERLLLPCLLLCPLPRLLFLLASSFFLPGSEGAQQWTDGHTARVPRLPKPIPSPIPEDTHGHAGLALLLPLAADPLLLCPLCSPLLLHREGILAWTLQGICILSVPGDRSLTPRALRAPREPGDSDPGERCIRIRHRSTTAATPGTSQ